MVDRSRRKAEGRQTVAAQDPDRHEERRACAASIGRKPVASPVQTSTKSNEARRRWMSPEIRCARRQGGRPAAKSRVDPREGRVCPERRDRGLRRFEESGAVHEGDEAGHCGVESQERPAPRRVAQHDVREHEKHGRERRARARGIAGLARKASDMGHVAPDEPGRQNGHEKQATGTRKKPPIGALSSRTAAHVRSQGVQLRGSGSPCLRKMRPRGRAGSGRMRRPRSAGSAGVRSRAPSGQSAPPASGLSGDGAAGLHRVAENPARGRGPCGRAANLVLSVRSCEPQAEANPWKRYRSRARAIPR